MTCQERPPVGDPLRGVGVASMTYRTNDDRDVTVFPRVSTLTWYDRNQELCLGFLQLDAGDTVGVRFGVLPFCGTGTYTNLPYFMLSAHEFYRPGVWGVYTDVAPPPRPNPPAPAFTVIDFHPTETTTAWSALLTAHLVWWADVEYNPPMLLTVSSLTFTARHGNGESVDVDFNAWGTEQFELALAAHGGTLDAPLADRWTGR